MQTKPTFGSPIFLRISKMLSNKTKIKTLALNSLSLLIAALVIAQSGCISQPWQQAKSLGLRPESSIDFAATNPPQSKIDSGKSIDQRYNELAGLQPTENTNSVANGNVEVRAQSPQDNPFGGFGFPTGSKTMLKLAASRNEHQYSSTPSDKPSS